MATTPSTGMSCTYRIDSVAMGNRAQASATTMFSYWWVHIRVLRFFKLSLLDFPSNHATGFWLKCWQMLHYRTTHLSYLSNGLIWTSEDASGLMQECLYEQTVLSETEENFLEGTNQSLDSSTQTVWPSPQMSVTLIRLRSLPLERQLVVESQILRLRVELRPNDPRKDSNINYLSPGGDMLWLYKS